MVRGNDRKDGEREARRGILKALIEFMPTHHLFNRHTSVLKHPRKQGDLKLNLETLEKQGLVELDGINEVKNYIAFEEQMWKAGVRREKTYKNSKLLTQEVPSPEKEFHTKDISHLEKILIQRPIFWEDNWEELLVKSLAYHIIASGKENINPAYHNSLKDNNLEESIRTHSNLEKLTFLLGDYHLDIFSLIRQYNPQDQTKWQEVDVNKLVYIYYLILAQDDKENPKAIFRRYLRHNINNLTNPNFMKNLSALFSFTFDYLDLNCQDENKNDNFYRILEYELLTEEDLSCPKTDNVVESLDAVKNLVFDKCLSYSKLLSFILDPTKKLKTEDEIKVQYKENNVDVSQIGLDIVLQLFKLPSIAHKENIDKRLFVNKWYSLEYVTALEESFDSAPLFRDLSEELSNLNAVRANIADHINSRYLKGILFLNLIAAKNLNTNQRLFSNEDIDYLLEPTHTAEHFKLMQESHEILFPDQQFSIDSILENNHTSLEKLSRRIRILKKFKEERRKFDYKLINELADIDIPNYLVIEKKGEGGMSKVYRCIDETLTDRPRALRLFRAKESQSTSAEGLINDLGAIGIFERGIKLQERLNIDYDFVLPVERKGRLGNHTFYSIERLIDHTLENEITGKTKLSKDRRYNRFIERFKPISDYLEILHRQENIIHTDITPSNLGVDRNERIKILDFQSAIIGSEKRDYFCGSRQYSAPEVILNNDYSEKSDVYSLGVCMFRYLTNKFPMNYGETDKSKEKIKDLIRRLENPKIEVRHDKIISKCCTRIPLAFRDLVQSCLYWDKEKRPDFTSIRLVLKNIDEFTKSLGNPSISEYETIIDRNF